jgi:hypothetical protein
LFIKRKKSRRFGGGFICCRQYSATRTLHSKKKSRCERIRSGFFLYPASSVGEQSLPISKTPIHYPVRLKMNPDQQTSHFVRPTLLPMQQGGAVFMIDLYFLRHKKAAGSRACRHGFRDCISRISYSFLLRPARPIRPAPRRRSVNGSGVRTRIDCF